MDSTFITKVYRKWRFLDTITPLYEVVNETGDQFNVKTELKKNKYLLSRTNVNAEGNASTLKFKDSDYSMMGLDVDPYALTFQHKISKNSVGEKRLTKEDIDYMERISAQVDLNLFHQWVFAMFFNVNDKITMKWLKRVCPTLIQRISQSLSINKDLATFMNKSAVNSTNYHEVDVLKFLINKGLLTPYKHSGFDILGKANEREEARALDFNFTNPLKSNLFDETIRDPSLLLLSALYPRELYYDNNFTKLREKEQENNMGKRVHYGSLLGTYVDNALDDERYEEFNKDPLLPFILHHLSDNAQHAYDKDDEEEEEDNNQGEEEEESYYSGEVYYEEGESPFVDDN